MTTPDENIAAGMTAAAHAIRAFADRDLRGANEALEELSAEVLLWTARFLLRSLYASVEAGVDLVVGEPHPEFVRVALVNLADSLIEGAVVAVADLAVEAEAARLGIAGEGVSP